MPEGSLRFFSFDHVTKRPFNVNATTALDATTAYSARTFEVRNDVALIETKRLFRGIVKVRAPQIRSKRGDLRERLLKGTLPTKERIACHTAPLILHTRGIAAAPIET
jgi:hypothetical protein